MNGLKKIIYNQRHEKYESDSSHDRLLFELTKKKKLCDQYLKV